MRGIRYASPARSKRRRKGLPLYHENSVFHIERGGPESLTLLLRALAQMPHTTVLRTELRDDDTSLVSVQVEDGSLTGRIDIGLYPQKSGTFALFKDFSLARYAARVTDVDEIERFQEEVAGRIRDEIELVCHGDDTDTCTF